MTDSVTPIVPAADGWQQQWTLREGTTYLNHGSFGPSPEPVRAARHRWLDELERQPMDFFCRQLEAAWISTRQTLARFVGTSEDNLALVDNATYGMNVVAKSFPLAPGDEVLLTDHEYGAVERIWRHACRRTLAQEPKIVELPWPVESADQIVDAISQAVSHRTRLIVVSHITSATACILPVERLCQLARQRGIAICIDGPHALVQVPLALDSLGCDFYTASCHKWLSAPFGSGFLYVAPWRQAQIQPPLMSWGRLPPRTCAHWSEEFHWLGTRDPTPLLAVPAAIAFLEGIGLDLFRKHTHALASYAREQIVNLTGMVPATPDSPDWYVSMVNVPLPDGDAAALQDALWSQFGIEVPIIAWKKRRSVRVSCHLYNRMADIDRLLNALRSLLT